jgi:hypothetical protein
MSDILQSILAATPSPIGDRTGAVVTAAAVEASDEEVAKARIAQAHEMALAQGIAPPQAFFAHGTELLDIGKKHGTSIQRRDRAQPLAVDGLPAFQAQIASEKRHYSDPLPMSALRMEEDGRIRRADGIGNGAYPSVAVFSHLASLSKAVPDSAAAYWRSIPKERRAVEINHVLSDPRNAEKEIVLGSRLTASRSPKERELFAIVSPRYTPHGPEEVADHLLELCQPGGPLEGARSEIKYDGTRYDFRMLAVSDVDAKHHRVGEIFKSAFRVKGRDDKGSGSPITSLGEIFCVLCINYTNASSFAHFGSVRHTGDVAQKVRDMLSGSADFLGPWLELWGAREAVRVTEQQGQDAIALLAGLKEPELPAIVTMPKVSREETAAALMQAFQKESSGSIAGLSGAFSRAAHEAPWHGPWASERMEGYAAAVLEMEPTLILDAICEKTSEESKKMPPAMGLVLAATEEYMRGAGLN